MAASSATAEKGAPASDKKDKDALDGVGAGDAAAAASSNPSVEQVTQQGGKAVKAEGQVIRDEVRKNFERNDVVTLAEAVATDGEVLKYDEAGILVNKDGKRIAMSADATDPDVGWTVQHKDAHPGGPSTTPDQTVHPDELPDPLAAIQAGLLPQNAAVLNVDPDKFKGKKAIEA